MNLYLYAYTENPDLFPALITIQSKIAHYLKNCLQYLFLSSECYEENRRVKFNKMIVTNLCPQMCHKSSHRDTYTLQI